MKSVREIIPARRCKYGGPTVLHIVALFVLGAMALVESAQSQERGNAGGIEIIVQQADYAAMLDALGLAGDRRQIANLLFDDYTTEITELTRVTSERRAEVAAELRRMMKQDEALSGSTSARMVERVLRISREARPLSDSARRKLLDDLYVILEEREKSKWEAARRSLNRKLMLNPVHDERSVNRLADLGITIDVFAIMDDATAIQPGKDEAGELATLFGDPAAAKYPPVLAAEELEDVRRRAREIREQSERNLDGLLKRHFYEERDLYQEMRAARMSSQLSMLDRLRRRRADLWIEKHNLLSQTATLIGVLVEEACGADARRAWHERVNAAMFPTTYKPCSADLMFHWVLSEVEASEHVMNEANRQWRTYVVMREGMRKRSMELAVDAREAGIGVLRAGGAGGELESRKDELDSEWREMVRETCASLRSVLPQDLQDAFDTKLAELANRGVQGEPLRF